MLSPRFEKPGYMQRTWQRVREEVEAGRQVYVVCRESRVPGKPHQTSTALSPFSMSLTPNSKQHPWRTLRTSWRSSRTDHCRGLRIDALHGRMSADDKDWAMRRFAAGPNASDGIDVLVSTTVIEVGVDVPECIGHGRDGC